jgi:molybdopterin/thiamine biosynthesis adenylyltransferase
VAVTLAHLGIGALTIVDPDVVEPSNLNRLYGATWEDASVRRPKVEVLARYARAARPQMEVRPIQAALDAPAAWRAASRCDATLVCVDNDAARLVANRLAVQYLLPMIDLATGIRTDGAGAITEAGGQVRTVLPGSFCLECIDGLDRTAAGRERAPAALRALYQARGYVTTEEVPAPAVATLNLAVAAEGTSELIALLTGARRLHPYLLYDWCTARWTALEASRRETCVVCGPSGYASLGDREPPPAVQEELWLPPYPSPAAVAGRTLPA